LVESIGEGDLRLTVIMRRFGTMRRAGRRGPFGVAPNFTAMRDAVQQGKRGLQSTTVAGPLA